MTNKPLFSILLLSCVCLYAQPATSALTSETIKTTTELQGNSTSTASALQPATHSIASDAQMQQKLKTFFISQLDKDMVEMPEKDLYNKTFDASSIAKEQDSMWKLWVEVNKESLEKSEFNKVLQGQHELIWDLPQQQKMKATMLSRGTTPNGGFPLFISLHGGGKAFVNNPWDSQSNTDAYQYNISLANRDREWFTLFFIPRMADDRVGRWYLQPQRMMVRRVCRLAAVSGFVNPKKIYIFGYSEGGYGSHRLALFMPDYFAGVSPIAACEPLKAPENLRNVAFAVHMGEEDNGFGRASYARLWKDKLAELQKQAQNDYIHKVNMIPGRGHHISPTDHTTWLLQNEKRTYPNKITYLYYNMTHDYDEEAYSNGVYYLDFRELKHQPNAEVMFEVEHKGNVFNITTDDVNNTKVQGSLGLFINDVDFSKPVEVYKEGKLVFKQFVQPNVGAMADALSLWCDPLRMFPAKIIIPMNAHHYPTAITTQTASDAHETARYNVLGMSIDKPEKGINIVKMSDGTTHKELIK